MLRRLLILGLVGGCVLAAFYFYYSPARMLVLYGAGKSPDCPLAQALDAQENLDRQESSRNAIRGASRLIESDPDGYELWATPRNRFWIPKGSESLLPVSLAEQQRNIDSLGEVRVRVGDVVLDCGANVGVYTRKALYDGAKLVVAVEPAPENLECLRRNFAQEIADGKVILYGKGVWDKEDVLGLNVDPSDSAADSFVTAGRHSDRVTQVPVTTIDKMVAELQLDRVDFIKMDIEGAEVKALRGARQTLERFHPRLAISADHQPGDAVEIPRTIHDAWSGYSMVCGPCSVAGGIIRPEVLLFH